MDAEVPILLKKIKDRLTWVVVFLVLIMLNTCSLDDKIGAAIRDARGSETEIESDADLAQPRVTPQTPPESPPQTPATAPTPLQE